MAEVLAKLEFDKDYFSNMVARCRKRASEYDIRKMVDQYMNEYEKVITK